MTPAQRGAFWQLICWQMQSNDGHLPGDIDALSALADLDLSDGHTLIVEAFPLTDGNKRANPRALQEWTRRREISDTRAKAGSKGATGRWQRKGNCHPFANGIPLANPATSTATPTTTSTNKGGQVPPACPVPRKRSTPPSDADPPESEIEIKIPVVGVGDEYPITKAEVAEFAELYPNVDVPQTLREIRGWNLTHPERRKTLKGVPRHVNAWLAREQNKGG